jgi:RsiW-degrading membrane proteinase PrsW (M82 family)
MREQNQVKYRVLRVLAWTLRVIGYIAIGGGIVYGFAEAADVKPPDNLFEVASALVVGGLVSLFLGETAFVLMDIEENTRSKT